MGNEIQKIDGKTEVVVQNGERSVAVVNQEGANFYLVNYPHIETTGEAICAIQSFSKEHYQLIVTGYDIFENNFVITTTDRALIAGNVPDGFLETHSTLTKDAIERIKLLPAIICNENTEYGGKTDSQQKAIFAYVKNIKKSGREIKIYFQPIYPIPQIKLCEYAIDFDIKINCALTDLNKSLWYIKTANIFEAFKDANIALPPFIY